MQKCSNIKNRYGIKNINIDKINKLNFAVIYAAFDQIIISSIPRMFRHLEH